MRRIIWLNSAIDDILRLREFVAANSPKTARKVAKTLKSAAKNLELLPNIGKPVTDLPDYRDLFIQFGTAGYAMRYRIHQDDIYIVHIRHYRETDLK